MTIERISTQPDWYEPYRISQAIRANGLIFLSGQAGIDHAGRTVAPGDLEAQGRQAFANLAAVLAEAGASLSDVVKVTIMVTDMSELDVIIKLRGEHFSEPYPADTLLQIARLAQPDWMIEIDAVAVDPAHR